MNSEDRPVKKYREYMQDTAADMEVVPTLYSWMIPVEYRKHIIINEVNCKKAKDTEVGFKNVGLK